MKKVLLTSTALVMTAGMAAAEVGLSGSAEIGLFAVDAGAGTNDEVRFHNDIDVTFSLSGASDNGLTFGASIDIDEIDGEADFGNATTDGAIVFLSGDFGTLTMGDTDGGFDWAMAEADFGGSINDDQEHGGWNGNTGFDSVNTTTVLGTPTDLVTGENQILRYEYSFGALAVAASMAQINEGLGIPALAGNPIDPGDTITGFGVKYDTALGGVDLGLGLGYQSCDSCDVTGVSVTAGFGNGVAAKLNVSQLNVDTAAGVTASNDHLGFALAYTVDALTLAVNWGENVANSGVAGAADAETSGVGFTAAYNLGGGASAHFGYGSTDNPGATADVDTWSAGLAFAF